MGLVYCFSIFFALSPNQGASLDDFLSNPLPQLNFNTIHIPYIHLFTVPLWRAKIYCNTQEFFFLPSRNYFHPLRGYIILTRMQPSCIWPESREIDRVFGCLEGKVRTLESAKIVLLKPCPRLKVA